MPQSRFKVVLGVGDWGSPLGGLPEFTTLEDAQAAARELRAEQRRAKGPATSRAATIEETTADGTVLTHNVD